jgi:hypothetical protein
MKLDLINQIRFRMSYEKIDLELHKPIHIEGKS